MQAFTAYGDYFELLGVRPLGGRLLAAEETGPGSGEVGFAAVRGSGGSVTSYR